MTRRPRKDPSGPGAGTGSRRCKPEKPLHGRIMFLDLPGNRGAQILENNLKLLGATVEKCFSKEVKIVITTRGHPKDYSRSKRIAGAQSKGVNAVPSPFSAGSARSLCSPPADSPAAGEASGRPMTRGKAIASKVNITKNFGTTNVVEMAKQWKIRTVHLDQIKAWVEQQIKNLQAASKISNQQKKNKVKAFSKCYVKFEAKSRHYRPLHQNLEGFPQPNLQSSYGSCPFEPTRDRGEVEVIEKASERVMDVDTRQDGGEAWLDECHKQTVRQSPRGKVIEKPVRELEKRLLTAGEMRRLVREQARADKKGYCELCQVKYDSISKHVKSESHRKFVNTTENFQRLDKLISRDVPSLQQFLTTCEQLSPNQHDTVYSDTEDEILLLTSYNSPRRKPPRNASATANPPFPVKSPVKEMRQKTSARKKVNEQAEKMESVMASKMGKVKSKNTVSKFVGNYNLQSDVEVPLTSPCPHLTSPRPDNDCRDVVPVCGGSGLVVSDKSLNRFHSKDTAADGKAVDDVSMTGSSPSEEIPLGGSKVEDNGKYADDASSVCRRTRRVLVPRGRLNSIINPPHSVNDLPTADSHLADLHLLPLDCHSRMNEPTVISSIHQNISSQSAQLTVSADIHATDHDAHSPETKSTHNNCNNPESNARSTTFEGTVVRSMESRSGASEACRDQLVERGDDGGSHYVARLCEDDGGSRYVARLCEDDGGGRYVARFCEDDVRLLPSDMSYETVSEGNGETDMPLGTWAHCSAPVKDVLQLHKLMYVIGGQLDGRGGGGGDDRQLSPSLVIPAAATASTSDNLTAPIDKSEPSSEWDTHVATYMEVFCDKSLRRSPRKHPGSPSIRCPLTTKSLQSPSSRQNSVKKLTCKSSPASVMLPEPLVSKSPLVLSCGVRSPRRKRLCFSGDIDKTDVYQVEDVVSLAQDDLHKPPGDVNLSTNSEMNASTNQSITRRKRQLDDFDEVLTFSRSQERMLRELLAQERLQNPLDKNDHLFKPTVCSTPNKLPGQDKENQLRSPGRKTRANQDALDECMDFTNTPKKLLAGVLNVGESIEFNFKPGTSSPKSQMAVKSGCVWDAEGVISSPSGRSCRRIVRSSQRSHPQEDLSTSWGGFKILHSVPINKDSLRRKSLAKAKKTCAKTLPKSGQKPKVSETDCVVKICRRSSRNKDIRKLDLPSSSSPGGASDLTQSLRRTRSTAKTLN